MRITRVNHVIISRSCHVTRETDVSANLKLNINHLHAFPVLIF